MLHNIYPTVTRFSFLFNIELSNPRKWKQMVQAPFTSCQELAKFLRVTVSIFLSLSLVLGPWSLISLEARSEKCECYGAPSLFKSALRNGRNRLWRASYNPLNWSLFYVNSPLIFKSCEQCNKWEPFFPFLFLEGKRMWFWSLRSKNEPTLLLFESSCQNSSIFNGIWATKDVNVVRLCFGRSFPSKFCLDES